MAVSEDPIQPPLLLLKSDFLSLPSPPSPDEDLLDYFSRKYSVARMGEGRGVHRVLVG